MCGVETKGRGVVLVGTSGGKTAHFADLCEESGLQLAEISPQTRRRLAEIFDTDYTGANPIDMGLGPEGVEATKTRRVLETLVANETVGLVGVCGDLPVDPDRFVGAANYVDQAMRAAEEVADAGTSVVFIDTRPARSGSQGRTWRVPVLEGSATSVRAIRRLVDFERACRAQAVTGEPPAAATAEAGGDRLPTGLDLELLCRQTWNASTDGVGLMRSDAVSDLLRRYGIDEVPGATVQLSDTAPGGGGLGPAVAAATEVGYPLAAKLHCPVHVHKSRAGLLKLGLRSTPDLLSAVGQMRRAHSSICSDPHPQMLHLQSMVDAGLEVIAGVKVDPQFGPVLAVGIGGVAVEALQQVSRALLPLTAGQVETLVESSPVGRVLETMPQADHKALHKNLLAISALAWDLRSVLSEADFNPITVLADGRGAWCVDVRVFVVAPGGARCR